MGSASAQRRVASIASTDTCTPAAATAASAVSLRCWSLISIFGLRTTQYRGYLADAGTGTDADDDSPTAFDRDEQHVDGARVPVPHPDPVAARHADTGQLLRQNVRRPIEFGPAER